MKSFPFEESPDTPVLFCSHLADGADLHWVHHVPGNEYVWQLMCTAEHDRASMKETTLAEAFRLFPEIEELADTPKAMDVSFKKGKNSGKWYDFHRG